MGIIRLVRLGIRVAEWATPHVKDWHQQKNLNRTEGARHLEARNFTEAERYLLAAAEEKHSPNHRVEILAQLAETQTRLNKLDAAAGNARAAAELAQASGNRAARWSAIDSLVGIQAAQGDLKGAAASLHAMEQEEAKRPDPDAARIVNASRLRAKLLLQAGRMVEALSAMEASCTEAEKLWGPEHVETAHGLSELGSLHSQAGDYAKALPYLTRAVSIYRVTTGFDSTEASNGLRSLAAALEESGEMDRAIAEYERLIFAQERMVGINRNEVAQVQVRLAALYVQAGRSSAARELLTLAIGILSRTPDTALKDALEIMAVAEDESGRPQEAERWRRKAALVVLPAPAKVS